jgi:hypothetical protein
MRTSFTDVLFAITKFGKGNPTLPNRIGIVGIATEIKAT